MRYESDDINAKTSSLDSVDDPVVFNDGPFVSDELLALKEAYFAGDLDAKQVRQFFTDNLTVGKAKGKPGPNKIGNRPLFKIAPHRIGQGSQPFSFYFQNWSGIYDPVKFFWISKNEKISLATAAGRRKVMLPVPPEKLEWANSNSLEEVVTAVGNTFLHSGPVPLETIQLESFFPHIKTNSRALNQFKPAGNTSIPDYIPQEVLKNGLYQAKTLRNMFMNAMRSAQPIRFTVCLPGPQNAGSVILTMTCVVSEFTWSYRHGNGQDIFYSMTLKRWVPQKLGGVPAAPKSSVAGVEEGPETHPGSGTIRPGEQPISNKYTIKRGDTLAGISDRYLGTPRRGNEIYTLNVAVLNKALRDHGLKAPNPHILYPGTVIRLPEK